MSNICPEPSFTDPGPWTLFHNRGSPPPPTIDGLQGPFSSPNSLNLRAEGHPTTPTITSATAVLALVPGLSYPAPSAWIKRSATSDFPTTMEIGIGIGTVVPLSVVKSDLSTNTWTQFTAASGFTANGSVGHVTLRTAGTTPTGAIFPTLWHWDDLVIDDGLPEPETVAYRKWEVMQALRDKLLHINGAGFYNDVSNRVFYSLHMPSDSAGEEFSTPYVCIPFDGQVQNIAEIEGRHMKLRWQQMVYGFVAGPSEVVASDKVGRLLQRTADLEDDITKAIFGDPKFEELVHDSRVLSSQTFAGEDADVAYGEVQLALQFDAYVDLGDLGPIST